MAFRPPGQFVSALSSSPWASHTSWQPTEWNPFLFTYDRSSMVGALIVTCRHQNRSRRAIWLCSMIFVSFSTHFFKMYTWTQSNTPSTPGNPASLWNSWKDCSLLKASLFGNQEVWQVTIKCIMKSSSNLNDNWQHWQWHSVFIYYIDTSTLYVPPQ